MIFQSYYTDKIDNNVYDLINELNNGVKLSKEEFVYLIDNITYHQLPYLQKLAYLKRIEYYQDNLYIRGLIEISNYCQQDCYYCGIRNSNNNVKRYYYKYNEIKSIIDTAYQKGYRTIVMQGGESKIYKLNEFATFIKDIKLSYHDLKITLSLGEMDYKSYKTLYEAGADRYLLRHESANSEHYAKLHPDNMKLESRISCLENLKEIGFQTGAGFMVGSPFQTSESMGDDFILIQNLMPQMVGIGPYLTNRDTPFSEFNNGDINHVLVCYCLTRLINPTVLLPSTTATSSLDSQGRLNALKSGCNVIMINLSLENQRKNYSLYENKVYKGDESNEYINQIRKDIESAGLTMNFGQGQHYNMKEYNNE